MATKEKIMSLTRYFQGRALNAQRKAFMDNQEREISPEIRQRATELLKHVEAGDYLAGAKDAETIDYLFKILMIQNYITPEIFKSLITDGITLSTYLKDVAENGFEEETPVEKEIEAE